MKILFVNLLALAALFCSVLSISTKNPIISVIYLISTFVLAAGYLILIGIHFIGISYIVVYVGAIAILFLFIILMINIKLSDILETGPQYTKNLPLAIAIGSLFIFIIFTLIPFNFKNVPLLSLLLNTIINNILANIYFGDYTEFQNFMVCILFDLLIAFVSFDMLINEFQQIEVLGNVLYTYCAVLLIILSIILLLALFATIIISKSKNKSKSNYKSNIKSNSNKY